MKLYPHKTPPLLRIITKKLKRVLCGAKVIDSTEPPEGLQLQISVQGPHLCSTLYDSVLSDILLLGVLSDRFFFGFKLITSLWSSVIGFHLRSSVIESSLTYSVIGSSLESSMIESSLGCSVIDSFSGSSEIGSSCGSLVLLFQYATIKKIVLLLFYN